MDIFLSYRRGLIDQLYAGRIYDYLTSHGFGVYYDLDEKANPTGSRFPEQIAKALTECRVIIALVGKEWIERIEDLKLANRPGQFDDWVRTELLHADPKHGRFLLPIYLTTSPGDIKNRLPPELAFVGLTNSHCIWSRFENSEKNALLERLAPFSPPPPPHVLASNSPRLELLCDRTRAEGRFLNAVGRSQMPRACTGLLIFGDHREGHSAMFDRIEKHTLKQQHIKNAYQERTTIRLELEEYKHSSIQEINQHIFTKIADKFGLEPMNNYTDVYKSLIKRRIDLAVLFALVNVDCKKQADGWEKKFSTLLLQIRENSPQRPRLIMALSMTYAAKPSWRFLPWRRSSVAEFFSNRFPEHFISDETLQTECNDPDYYISIRLDGVTRTNVEDWCSHPRVRRHVNGMEREIIRAFEGRDSWPMDDVIDHLGKRLRNTTVKTI